MLVSFKNMQGVIVQSTGARDCGLRKIKVEGVLAKLTDLDLARVFSPRSYLARTLTGGVGG
jgi:hypothetical protein